MNVEAEIRDLKRRVGELEGAFGFLTQQLKSVHRDLLAFQEETSQSFQAVDRRFDGVDSRLDRVEKEIRDFRRDLPGIVGSAMREALEGRPARPRRKGDKPENPDE